MNKFMKTFFNVVLALFVLLNSFPNTGFRTVNALDETNYINADGVVLSKEATLVEGSLNQWDIDLKLELEPSDATHDIVLVIDTSGSMQDHDRLVKAKDAARIFTETILSEDFRNVNRVALVSYSNGPTVQSNFTQNNGDLQYLISSLAANGGTFTQAAIRDARNLLSRSNADKKSIVLLTDGAPSFGYDLSESGLNKYKESDKEIIRPKINQRDYEVYWSGSRWQYKNGSNPSDKREHNKLMSNKESSFLESDFNYVSNFGGHGALAFKHLPKLKDSSNEYFLNLYATSEAEAKFANEAGYDFYSVGLGLRDDQNALNMLNNMASDSSKYFDADDSTSNLSDIFVKIANELNFPFSNMNFTDPMGDSVDYVGDLTAIAGDVSNLTFDQDLNSILGSLTRSNFTLNKETEKYEFHIRYRVQTNKNAIEEIIGGNEKIMTNGDASFEYTNKKTNVPNESLFPKPEVKPTILAVTKELYDENEKLQSLVDDKNQRSYEFTLWDGIEEIKSRINNESKYRYFVLADNIDYKVNETSIVNDDISAYDTLYRLDAYGASLENENGAFTLKPESGLNVLSIVNKPKKDYIYDNYSLEKTVADDNGNGLAEYGEKLTYTISIKNGEDSIFVRDLYIQDTLEDILPYINHNFDQNIVIYRESVLSDEVFTIQQLRDGFVTHLKENETITLSFEVKVIDTYDGLPDSLDNTVKTKVKDSEKQATARIENREPRVSSSKSVVDANKNGYAEPGETLTYSINVKNTGIVDHNNLFVQDRLNMIEDHIQNFDHLTFTLNGKEEPIQKLIEGFYVSDFKPSETLQIEFDVIVKEDLNTTLISELLNTARVDNQTPQAKINTGSPVIVANKTVSDNNGNKLAEPGETLNYEIVIENKGKVAKSNVKVQDELQDLLDIITKDNFNDIGSLKVVRDLEVDNKTVQDLINGFKLKVDAKEIVKLQLSVILKDDFNSDLHPILINNAYVDDHKVSAEIPTGMPKLSTRKTVVDENRDGFAEAGEKLNYTIAIENNGNAAKSKLFIQDKLEDLVDHTNILLIKDNPIVSVENNGNIEFVTLQSLMNGFYIDVEKNSQVLINFSLVVSEEFDSDEVPKLSNLATVGTDNPNVEIPTGKAKISSQKDVRDANSNGYAEAGEALIYTIKISNTGNVKKENLKVQDTLSDLIPYIQDITKEKVMIGSTEFKLEALVSGIEVDVEAGETLEVIFSVKVKEEIDIKDINTLRNIATVGDDTPKTEIPTGQPLLSSVKKVEDENRDGYAEAGEQLNYEIVIHNSGDVKKESLWIQDNLSDLIDYIEHITDSMVYVNDQSRPLQDLLDGFSIDINHEETIKIAFSVTLKTDFDADEVREIKNIATIGEDVPEVVIPTGKPKISAKKEVFDENQDGFAEAGERLDYLITVTNTGTVKQNKLNIQDDLSNLLSYVEDTTSSQIMVNGKERPLQDLIDGFVLDVEAQETVLITFSVKLKKTINADLVKTLSNIATVGDETPNVEIPTGAPFIVSTKSIVDENENGYAEVGERLDYSINIVNTGNVEKENLYVQDNLKDLIPYIKNIDNSIVVVNGESRPLQDLIQGFYVNVSAGQAIDIQFSVSVSDDLDVKEVSTLANIATIGEGKPEVTIPTGEPIIVASKNVVDDNEDGYAEAGEKLHYTITVENKGDVAHKDLLIKDEMIDLIDHIESIGKTVMLVNGEEQPLQNLKEGFSYDLDPSEVLTITFTVVVKTDLDTSVITKLSNLATIGEENPDVEIPTGKAVIQSEKKVSDENQDGLSEAGERLSYTIRITNTGTVKKTDLFVQDKLSDLLPHIDSIEDEIVTINNVERPLKDLIDGFEIEVDVKEEVLISFGVSVKEDFDAIETEELSNLATVGDDEPDVKIPTGVANISAIKKVVDENKDGYVEVGEKLDYTIVVKNTGTVEKRNLLIQDSLEQLLPHIETIESSVVSISNGDKRALQDLVDGFVIDVKPNETITLSFSVTVKNDFDASTTQSLANMATIGDETPEVVIPSGEAIIVSLKKVADENDDGYAEAGERLDYTINIKNIGNVIKKDLFVQDTLSDLINHIEDISDEKVVYKNQTRPLEDLVKGFSIDVNPQEIITLNFSVVVKEGFNSEDVKVLSNLATVGEETPEVEIATGKSNIRSFKEVVDENKDGYVEAGESVTYKITISNTGEVLEKGLKVKDDLSQIKEYIKDISHVSMSVDGEKMPLTKLVNGLELDVDSGETIEIMFTVVVLETFDASKVTSFANLATVGAEEPEVVIPTGQPIIKSIKEVEDENKDGYAEAGERLKYTITVTNDGDVKKEELLVRDTLENLLPHIESIEEEFMFVNDLQRPLTDLVNGFTVDVDAKETLFVSFGVTVKDDLDVQEVKTLSNLATVGDQTPEVVIPTGKAIIMSSKTVSDKNKDGYAEAGERLDYTINIKNIGNVKKNSLKVQDDLSELLEHIDSIEHSKVNVSGELRPLVDLVNGFDVNVEAGEEILISFSVVVKENFDASKTLKLSNLANIGEETPGVEIPTGEAIIVSRKEVTDENNDGFAEANEQLTYTITINNLGLVKKEKVFIQDTLSTLIDHIQEPNQVKVNINDKFYSLNDLQKGIEKDIDAGEEVIIVFTVVVNEKFNAKDVATISNLATIGEDTPEVVIPTGEAIIRSNKQVIDENENGYAEAGEQLDYIITITNIGNVEKKGLFVKDNLEHIIDHIEDISYSLVSINDKERLLSDLMNGFEIDINAGETIDLRFSVKVKESFDADKILSLVNLATIGENTPEVTIPSGKPQVIASKHVQDANKDGFAEAGERLDYTIKVSNIGNVTDKQVHVQDNLEFLLDYVEDVSELNMYIDDQKHDLSKLVEGFDLILEPGEKTLITFSIKIKEDLVFSEVLELYNVAKVNNEEIEATITLKPNKPINRQPKEEPQTPSTGIRGNQVYISFTTILLSLIVLLKLKRKYEKK